MALITITIHDTPTGPQMQIFAEPLMPKNILDGAPTAAQTVAAVMLNAVRVAQAEAEEKRIAVFNSI